MRPGWILSKKWILHYCRWCRQFPAVICCSFPSRRLVGPECSSYTTLDDETRLDSYSVYKGCDQSSMPQPAWYRFTGASGTRMPTSCVPMNRCGTHASGWMEGEHPTLREGIVSRKVCYHWSSKCCNWENNIEVRQCPGGFFVYKLVKPPHCSLRYCGSASSLAGKTQIALPFSSESAHLNITQRFPSGKFQGHPQCNRTLDQSGGSSFSLVSPGSIPSINKYFHLSFNGFSFPQTNCVLHTVY